jgi:hypothetical protein
MAKTENYCVGGMRKTVDENGVNFTQERNIEFEGSDDD